MPIRTVAVMAAMILLPCADSLAATLILGHQDAEAGDTGVSLPLSLDSGSGESVAGIQADVVYDSGVVNVSAVTRGPAAEAAGKDVNFSELAAGRVRLIVAGFNQNVIPDGVVAYVLVDVAADALAGEHDVELTEALLADPVGNEVPVTTASGSIQIGAAEGEGEGEGDADGSGVGCLGAATRPDSSYLDRAGSAVVLVACLALLGLVLGHRKRARRG